MERRELLIVSLEREIAFFKNQLDTTSDNLGKKFS